jgi:hypothetical protein
VSGAETSVTSDSDTQGVTSMSKEDEAAFVRLMLGFVEKHELRTPDFIRAHIRAFDAFGATEMADFWRSALAFYEQAYEIAETKSRGEPLLKVVR